MVFPKAGWSFLPALAVCLVAAAAVAILFWFDPSTASFYPTCYFHRFTGLLCPGCGSLRAAHQLLHGHIIAALQFNALAVVVAGVIACIVLWRSVALLAGSPASGRLHPRWAWIVLIAIVLFAVARNLPFAAFSFLSPPATPVVASDPATSQPANSGSSEL